MALFIKSRRQALADRNDEPRFEELVAGIEAVVNRLQSGNLPLDEALAQYEKGQELLKAAQVRLAGARATLEKYRKDGSLEIEGTA